MSRSLRILGCLLASQLGLGTVLADEPAPPASALWVASTTVPLRAALQPQRVETMRCRVQLIGTPTELLPEDVLKHREDGVRLDAAEADRLLRSIQAHRSSAVLSAPTLQLFDGQTGAIQSGDFALIMHVAVRRGETPIRLKISDRGTNAIDAVGATRVVDLAPGQSFAVLTDAPLPAPTPVHDDVISQKIAQVSALLSPTHEPAMSTILLVTPEIVDAD